MAKKKRLQAPKNKKKLVLYFDDKVDKENFKYWLSIKDEKIVTNFDVKKQSKNWLYIERDQNTCPQCGSSLDEASEKYYFCFSCNANLEET